MTFSHKAAYFLRQTKTKGNNCGKVGMWRAGRVRKKKKTKKTSSVWKCEGGEEQMDI